ncbi:MAG: hypothetical protein IPG96_17165 [Proteobacteria bacterium]|jgi:hypothetical protein|nr:hypothetical protein [Pseudomonadota bacterium]
MQVERRRKRSNYRGLSLHYWLAAVAARTRALAFVLADPSGLLIASSLRGPEAEELAAIVPLLHRDATAALMEVKWRQMPIQVDQLTIDGSPVLLCVVGDRPACHGALEQAAGGVERILVAPA